MVYVCVHMSQITIVAHTHFELPLKIITLGTLQAIAVSNSTSLLKPFAQNEELTVDADRLLFYYPLPAIWNASVKSFILADKS